ncbi:MULTISPECIES: glutamine--fructose-6-phosphate transaminase (isomerizing) [Brachybacterium]|uniref:glutamine--fructose-6-phosphate transaminase (isomerizing) n=1 Tax=Brachybacterium TaxID=43668 RepID=UPI000BB847BD|nr:MULTISPECIES: glutamine--fructose-6-phosphate transaminase (isomerizing) [Brachybacterium]PCC31684.1 glutamine--fructose-6-phosphate transaminase (isomerizing) [Brachybacterium alimentarium]RCS64535.1 glutamine--fructose-6-phosphate transaminase (isomerizing) [Brachybacterium sp. JB7]RCS75390.1 glutamine--fructose-6-phosphate transaminase (isomerizing) [Brachybacterium alimentarium]RCS87610.1 glutamine--fructose-6-phosphate transaminase (isomerizing) [Brachybacterium alimentarium]
MCGIVGYAGPKASAPSSRPVDVALQGLARLEYRGYDSAGVAVIDDDAVRVTKRAGKLANLREALAKSSGSTETTGRVAIAHTRWATHGGPTDTNAHPHLGGHDHELAVVHNGIIENFATLRADLEADGFRFASETDSEAAAHLVAREMTQTGDLTEAMRRAAASLEGAFTLLAVHRDAPDTVVAARRNSPLVVGLGDGENFLGSDVAAFVDSTKEALEIGQDQVVTVTADDVRIIGFDGAEVTDAARYTIEWDAAAAQKGGYPSFMAKEIHEQAGAVADTLLGRLENGSLKLDEMDIDPSVLRSVDKIVVVACGTAANAGAVAKYAIEHWCRIPTEVELAHEFRYRDPVVTEKTLVVAISQSGETMDTLMAVRHAREQGAKVIALCNTRGSTIPRESDAALYLHVGPEIAVASTKAYLGQIAACYLLGLFLAQVRGNLYPDEIAALMSDLEQIPDQIQQVLDSSSQVERLAQDMKDATSVLFLGRHVGYPTAMEGALKLKEIAYIHAEGFAAGELKHGPIALVEEGQPVFVIVPSPNGRHSLHSKVVSNIQEVRARGARTLVIAEEGDDAVVPYADEVIRVPATRTLFAALLTVIPLQIFSCELATAKGLDVDQPRNLAKSVTVE